jgi:hypothetical protein
MKYFFLIATSAVLLIACKSKEENPEATTTAIHDAHVSAANSATVDVPMPDVPDNARVFFSNLKDGQVVTSPVKIEMGADAVSVDTANGKLKPASGHHHILVDIDSIKTGEVIIKDSVHLHFGNAQTSAEVKLPPGKHTLVLQFADALHRSYGSKLTNKVTIEVKE